jgi:hypothetical protein
VEAMSFELFQLNGKNALVTGSRKGQYKPLA